MSQGCGELVWGLLNGVTTAHVYHLKSRSYAQHMALGELYEKLSDLTDALVEAYQGAYGLVDDYPTTFELPAGDAVQWLRGFSRFLRERRADVGNDTELQNICDEIAALLDTTNYKLTFLG